MSYPIEKSLLNIYQADLYKSLFIIAHESGNPNNVGTNSLNNEIAYMKRNYSNAFVSHWVGAGGKIVQIAKTGKIQWGAGPKANPYAYAQVELARTNNRTQFQKDYAAYVWLLRQLAQEANLPCTLNSGTSLTSPGIKTHAWISRYLGGTDHVDPDDYLASWGVSMTQFKKDIEAAKAPTYLLHLVVRGDTLWALSRKHHMTVAELKALNHLKSDLILIGQVLKVKAL
ncbi:LysM peptidoglycan-binding domain-containing protein [Jeotgalibaca sp. MA1X17-3]|uniref:LysM peptidoglycan-binding domain-containing protein n=1 Tax=Jeotgalibaca sp. MA1X17-3 TaxID=2908211 RepID=UPI002883363B|nr:LysM peptidoglycan-binding domain-containing protein [Jeotgalibaca sp. MA1X17-3]